MRGMLLQRAAGVRGAPRRARTDGADGSASKVSPKPVLNPLHPPNKKTSEAINSKIKAVKEGGGEGAEGRRGGGRGLRVYKGFIGFRVYRV